MQNSKKFVIWDVARGIKGVILRSCTSSTARQFTPADNEAPRPNCKLFTRQSERRPYWPQPSCAHSRAS